ncbi:MAG: VOC family protein [Candidatus Dormibacteraeota bacterium]|nr:VOC family protein [Candidatus Dormibacteraeota bacterium]
MKATMLNHVSVHADDLEESARFYEEVFGLERLPTPDFGHPVIWLGVGDRQLHLFRRDTSAPRYHHFALDVDDYVGVYRLAREKGFLDGGPRILPDGGLQMYVKDPSGNLIEIDCPDHRTLDLSAFGGELEQVPGPPEATLYTGRAPARSAS